MMAHLSNYLSVMWIWIAHLLLYTGAEYSFRSHFRESLEKIVAESSARQYFPCVGVLSETPSLVPILQPFPWPLVQFTFPILKALLPKKKNILNECPVYIILYNDPKLAIEIIQYGILQDILAPRNQFYFVEINSKLSHASTILLSPNLSQLPYLFHWQINMRLNKSAEKLGNQNKNIFLTYNSLRTRPVMLRGIAHSISRFNWMAGDVPKTSLFLQNLKDWQGQTLLVSTFHTPPHVIKRQTESKTPQFSSGADVYLVNALANVLNLETEYREPRNLQKWGHDLGNGSWDGLVGLIQAGTVDMGVANIFMTRTYLRYLDMPYPYNTVCISALTRNPPFKPQWQALLLPFTFNTWLFTLGIFLASGILLWTQARVYRFVLPNQDAGMFYGRIGFAFFYAVQILTGIAGTEDRSPWPIRSSVSLIWATFFLLTTGYKASLTASLSFPARTPPIDTLHQLLLSNLEWGGWGEELGNLLAASTEPYGKAVGQAYQPIHNVTAALERVAWGKWALFENKRFLEYTAATEHLDSYGKPTLHLMKECGLPMNIGLALPKNSPLKTPLDDLLPRFAASGMIPYWFKTTIRESRTFSLRNTTSTQSENDHLILNLGSLQGAFFVWIFSCIPSILCFISEIWSTDH